MKTQILFFFLFAFTLQNMNSQNQMYREIQNKKGNTVFRKIKPFQVSKEYNIPLSNQFKEKDDLLFFKYNPLSMKNAGEAIDIEIPLNINRKMEIEVVDVTDTYNYEIVTDQGHRYRPNKNIKHYRGVVKNNVNSIVALTCFENEIMGIIATEDGNFNIAYDKVTGLHVSYNDRNLKDKYSFLCSTIEDESVMYDAKVLLNPSDDVLLNPSNIRSTTFNIKHVRFYFETEFDIYQARGNSVSSVEAFVTALYNQVATLYRNEGIFTTISEIHVWTTTDPYTENNTSALLNNFQNTRTSINGDIGQLLTFRSIGGGKAAGFNGLCNSSTRQKLSVCGIDNLFNAVPNYSWSVFVSTHEFGHLFGSRHTHACVWNGNNTAIDGCAIPEGGCTRPPTPTNGGTIMSYCHLQDVGVNFNLGFGPQPGNVIRNSVNSASCLSSYSIQFTGPSIICGQNSYTYTIQNLPPNTTVTWSSSNNSMTLISGQGTPNAVFQQTGFTNGEIRATIAPFTTLRFPITICQPFLSGPSAICNQATYTVENLPAGLQVQWQVHPGLHVYGQTNNSISVSKQSLTSPIEKGWVKATIVGTNITFRNDDILVWKSGTTQTNDLLVGQLDASGGQVEAVYPIQELGRNFQWSASNNWQAMIQGYHFTDFSGTPQSGASSVYITVRFDDPCGSETIIYKEFELPSTYGFSLSPNPVTDVTTLQWKLSGEAISMNSNSQVTQPVVWNRSPYEIQLWSGMTMLRSFRTNEPTFQIPMAGLPAGLYFVRVVKDGQTYTQKLIKK